MKVQNIVKEGISVEHRRETVFESNIEGPSKSGIALARIIDSEPHYHNKMTEWYLVTSVKSKALLYCNGKKIQLKPYDVITIPPKTTHYVKSTGKVEVWVISHPKWNKKDHHMV